MKEEKKVKKKLILVCSIALIFALGIFTGCGESADSEEAAADEDQFPVTIEDNDYFTLELTGVDDFWGDYKVQLTNKTDKDFNFSVEKAVANGERTLDTFIYIETAAGTKATDTVSFLSEDMDDFEKGEKISIEMKYTLVDPETFEDISSGTVKFDITKQ